VACPQTNVLGAFLAGDLPLAERAAIVDHAATCEMCRAVVAALVSVAATPSGGAPLAAALDDAVAPGDRIGRYVIERRLGVGGMGVVYAAVDSELHRRVAVKLLRDDREAGLGSQGRERLLREARTLAKLSHPNVVTVFDVGVHRDQLYLAMELVEGGNLAAWLRREPRTIREIVERMREAGAGLAAAHAAGVVHRDVKPDNILVGTDGRARMTDFGLARSSEVMIPTPAMPGAMPVVEAALTRTHALVGTPVYMAPEQLAGASADERSDQWSFCATLYEAVAGVRPFAAGDVDTRRSAIAAATLAPPVRAGVPSWVRRIAMRGLRADPARRWPSVAAIVDALGRRSRRRRLVLAIGAVAALVIAAVVIAIALTHRPPSDRRLEYLGWADGRGACNCPFAACLDGKTCIGQCDAPRFTFGQAVAGVSVKGTQEALLGATPDGNAILYASGQRCAVDRLLLARRGIGQFVPRDLTDQLVDKLGYAGQVIEGAGTIAPDGRSIIIRTPDMKRFVRLRLGPDDVITEVDAAELADVAPPLSGDITLATPVLSADQRTLYFTIHDAAAGQLGPLHGHYESVRADLSSPFPRGTPMRGRAQSYDYITGVSSDGLVMFMTHEYVNRVLTRPSTNEPFGDPAPTVLPPMLYGWRGVPIEGCARVLTTDTPGGCAAEDIIYLEAVPRAN
jgi:hypothetical protein